MAVVIEYGKPNKLASVQSAFVSFPYNQDIVDVIRGLPERIWIPKEKLWEIPHDAVSVLVSKFPNEKFKIIGSPVNDKKFNEKLIEHTYEVPSVLKTSLYEYQKEDFNELMNFDRYLLLLDTGTGKSIVSIAAALKRKELGQVKHCLIICGVNTIKFNWKEEILTHAGMNSLVLGARMTKFGLWQTRGTSEKLEDLNNINSFFIITNIESLRNKAIKDKIKNLIDDGTIGMMIVDEIHRCRNSGSQQGKALLLLAKHVKYFYQTVA